MAQLSIDKVFKFVQFVANKESRGWVSPEEFNIGAEVAQLSLYSELEATYKTNKASAALMRPFLKSTDALSGGSNDLAGDFRIAVNSWVADAEGDPVRYIKVKEVDIDEIADYYHSSIVAPSVDYPIFFIDWNTGSAPEVSKAIILPETFPYSVIIKYLKSPTAPLWNYELTTATGRPTYASTGGLLPGGISIDFEFDSSAFMEISSRVLQYVGINIDKEQVTQYAIAKQQE